MPFPTRPLAAFACALCLLLAATTLAQDSDPRRRTAPPDGLRRNVPQVFALVGGSVVPRPGERIEDCTIVLRDGRIVAVGPDAEVPADAERIDLAGKTVYAGFVDAHATLPAAQSKLDPALNGASAANYWNANVVPQVAASRVLKLDADLHEKLRKAGVVARAYAPSSGLLKGTIALVSTAQDAAGETAVLADSLGMAAELTPSRGSWRSATYPGSPMGAVALVRQAMYDARWYDQAQAAAANDPSLPRPERNDALAALQPVVDGTLPLWVECGDELYALRADRLGREFNVPVVLVGSGDEYRRMSLIKAANRPVIVPLDFPKPPDVSTPARAEAVDLQELMDWDLAPSNPAMLADAGLRIAFTTRGLKKPEVEFHANLKKAMRRGLSPDAALAALTTDAARICDASGVLGTIEPGRTASLVVADGDLFDPESKAKITAVWVDGVRDVVVPDPVVDLRGTWQTGDFTFEIKGDRKLAGTYEATAAPPRSDAPATRRSRSPYRAVSYEPAPERQKLTNVRQSADRLSFTLDASPFGQAGVAVVSLTSLGGRLHGTALLPNGTRRTVVADLIAPPSTRPADQEEQAIEAEPATDDYEPVEATEGVPTEAQVIEDDYAEGTQEDAEPIAEMEEGEAEIEPTPATRPAAVAEADEKNEPLFPVNYPLGAYGRETADAPEATDFDIVNATIWTCGPAGKIESGVVMVRDGKIAGVFESFGGYTLQSQVQPSDNVIDAAGKHITPGLIDCHSHIATDGGVNEGTQAVTCEVRIGDFVDPDDIDLYRQLAGGVTSANILHGSANPIGGQNQVLKFRWGQGPEAMKFAQAPPGVKFALGENVKQSNWSNPNPRYPQTRMGVPEVFADAFRAALDYERAKADFEAEGGLPVRTDLELEALAEMLLGERLIHCHSYRQDEILATMRVLEEFGITIGSFQHILEGYKVAKEMAEHGATASAFSDWWAYKFEVYDAIPYAGAITHDAGVVTSFNSDDAELARRLNTEAAKAVKYGGVPEEEALKFVTLNPAKQLRIDEYVGSLEPGKHADLVVWSGHPLGSTSVAEQTWVDGRLYYDRSKAEAERDLIRDMRSKLVQRILAGGEAPAAPGETPPRPGSLWPRHDVYCHGHGHE